MTGKVAGSAAMIRRIQNRGYATVGRIAAQLERLSVGDESNAAIDATNAVTLMTVHASKGLEAKIVFLGDTCTMPSHHHDPKLLEIGKDDPVFAWTPGKSHEPEKLGEAREASRRAWDALDGLVVATGVR